MPGVPAASSMRREAGGHSDADGRDVRPHELDCVVDGQPGGHDAARRVNVHAYVAVRVLALQVEELSDHQIRDLVVDGRAEEYDPFLQQQ